MKPFFVSLSLLFTCFLCVFCVVAEVDAYPNEQLEECIVAAQSNSSLVEIPLESIKEFCDCALIAIVDEGSDEIISANKCAKDTLN